MWLEAEFSGPAFDLEAFETLLLLHGIESWQVTGGGLYGQMERNYDYLDEALRRKPCTVKVTLEANEANRLLLEEISAVSGVRARFKLQDEKEWAEEWKKYYKPLEIGRRLCVCPAWESYENKERRICRIEPGGVFGTGLHQTTQLCLEFLDSLVRGGESVLDLGCGSGILAIAALLLGARTALGVDIEEAAESAARQNALLNGVQERLTVICGDVLSDEALRQQLEKYDIITANIVADVIIALAPLLKRLLKPGGVFIASGIIDARLAEVKDALEACGFKSAAESADGDWRALLIR